MKLRRLLLREFRHLADVDVVFDDGLTALVGPNGSGRSTLLEAILWALHGRGAARKSESSLRRIGALPDRDTVAELHFSIGADEYCVRRSLNASGAVDAVLLQVGGAPEGKERGAATRDAGGAVSRDAAGALARGAAEVGVCVASLTSATRDVLLHSCVTGRRELQQFGQLAPQQRLQTLARLLGRAGAEGDQQYAVRRALQREIADADERIRTLDSAASLLTQYTTELSRLRPELDQAEADAARLHDDWAQKRQDVDTRLASYRRRAEELKQQIDRLANAGSDGNCPTCEQPLGARADGLVARLDDELYVNAQDMKWLLQRQAQLANRPADVMAADTRRARLRAAVDDRTERAARCEQAAQELWTLAGERKRALRQLELLGESADSAPTPDAATLLRGEDLRRIAAVAGDYLRRVTDGCYSGLELREDGRVYALVDGAPAPVMSGGDEELITLLLRIAVMHAAGESRPQLQLLLLDEPFGTLDDDRVTRLLQLLKAMLPRFPQILVSSRSTLVAQAAQHALLFSVEGGTARVTVREAGAAS